MVGRGPKQFWTETKSNQRLNYTKRIKYTTVRIRTMTFITTRRVVERSGLKDVLASASFKSSCRALQSPGDLTIKARSAFSLELGLKNSEQSSARGSETELWHRNPAV